MPPNKLRLSKKQKRLERKRREIEKKRSNFLEYLRREIKYGNITRRRYEKKWKELLTKLSLEKTREDLEYSWQSFEWMLDMKDFVISKLMDELKKANDQATTSLENHIARIEMFMSQYKKVLESMHTDYLKELENLKAYYKVQDEEYAKANELQQNVLKSVLFRMEQDTGMFFKEQMAEKYIFFESRTNEYLNASEQLETDFDRKIGKIWSKCEEAYNAYMRAYKRKTKEFQNYCEAYKEALESNDRNLRIIVHLGKVQKALQAKLENLYNIYGRRLDHLTVDLERYRRVLSTLVGKVTADMDADDAHIKLVVSCCVKTLDYLERLTRKGELLEKMMWCNKKYETLHEKVLPYPTGKSALKAKKEINVKLLLFHFKMANVNSTRMALNEEKKFLKLENTMLTKKLENYCRGYQSCVYENAKYRQKSRDNSIYRCRLPERSFKNSKLNL
ncbi:hypothetical protein WA026_015937 [Henosepilachna vigintioctopunctata]|uniref:Dynein regulatory complex subunit 2 n=1 Tax=Henosepilachna vigintioctopunctata TaxID=420089 RepID=A0AAW1UAG1_9CUCU